MHFHIVKMYKDKEVKKNVKDMFVINVWRKNIFDIYVTEYGTALTTKLPNSEQSYKGKVKTHNYINRQNQSITGKLWKRNDPDLVQAFLKKWWVESNVTNSWRQTLAECGLSPGELYYAQNSNV